MTTLDLLHPQVSWGGRDGIVGMEFPLLQWLTGVMWRVTGESHVVARLVALLFSVGGVACLYGLGARLLGRAGGLAAAALMAVAPSTVFFGRSFLSDTPMLTFMIAAVWAWDVYFWDGEGPAGRRGGAVYGACRAGEAAGDSRAAADCRHGVAPPYCRRPHVCRSRRVGGRSRRGRRRGRVVLARRPALSRDRASRRPSSDPPAPTRQPLRRECSSRRSRTGRPARACSRSRPGANSATASGSCTSRPSAPRVCSSACGGRHAPRGRPSTSGCSAGVALSSSCRSKGQYWHEFHQLPLLPPLFLYFGAAAAPLRRRVAGAHAAATGRRAHRRRGRAAVCNTGGALVGVSRRTSTAQR